MFSVPDGSLIVFIIGILVALFAAFCKANAGVLRGFLTPGQKREVDELIVSRLEAKGKYAEASQYRRDFLKPMAVDLVAELRKQGEDEKPKRELSDAEVVALGWSSDELGPGEVWVLTDDGEVVSGKVIESNSAEGQSD